MDCIKLIEKGTRIYIYNIVDAGEKYEDFIIIIGYDILKSEHNYYEYEEGVLVLEYDDLLDAINNYMNAKYSELVKFSFILYCLSDK